MTEQITKKLELQKPTGLEMQVFRAFDELEIKPQIRTKIFTLLQPLKEKSAIHHEHYEHSLRVGLLAKKIAGFLHLDKKPLFFAGLLHDLGKREIRSDLLGKTEAWTPEDAKEIQPHVMHGYNSLKEKNIFEFVAQIILWHHKFQENGYPQDLPEPSHNYSKETRNLIREYGRILALADVYDASHRDNSRLGVKGKLTDTQIEEQMLGSNLDEKGLIEDLYKAEIFINANKKRT